MGDARDVEDRRSLAHTRSHALELATRGQLRGELAGKRPHVCRAGSRPRQTLDLVETPIETLRLILFKDIACIRINEAFPSEEYETDLLESDPKKLLKLHTLGRESFAKQEAELRAMFGR